MRNGRLFAALPGIFPAAALAALALPLPPAGSLRANPQGPQIRHGQVRIQQSPGHTRIHQSSQRAVIDWQSFSVRSGETTRFVQPGSRAAVLNRVRGPEASRIEGALRANGQVYLINPNGVLVGPGGTIDVGGFVASTLDVADDAFLQGGDLRFSGNSAAAVVNLGSISALDGDVVLMGASVRNAGSIRAPRGTAALAAGSDVLLAESGEERVFVRGGAGSAENTGSIEANVAELKAHGGNLYGMAVKNEGRVAATGVTRSGGRILLTAKGGAVRSTGVLRARREDGSGGTVQIDAGREGRAEVGGSVDTSSATGAGGDIAVLGRQIEIFDGALILNDGATSGGATRIGGGLRGEDPAFANAENVVVGRGARLGADATGNGNGGLVIVFAEGSLVFDGSISARGGRLGGNGGFAELSGKETVRVANLAGRIDLSAPAGQAGTVLYDPTDISILPGSASPIGGSPVTQNTLYAGDISAFLAAANLVVTTASAGEDAGNITMDGAASITWSSASSLTFLADNDFVMNPGATISAVGDGAFDVAAGRSILLGPGAEVATTDGNLSLLANQQGTPTAGAFSGLVVDGATVRSLGSGNVALRGRGGDGTSSNYGVRIDSGAQVIGGTSGTLLIEGVGGSGAGSLHTGVQISGAGTLVGSGGADVSIGGYGGSDPTNGFSSGVFVTGGATVSAGGAGSLGLVGVGGAGSDFNNVGVFVTSPLVGVSTTLSTGGGDLSIVGTGGGNASSFGDEGVRLISNNGITLVESNGGRIMVEGTGGPNAADNFGIDTSASIASGGGEIVLISDRIRIGSHVGSQIQGGTGTTVIRPRSDNFSIQLGNDNVPGVALGITAAELSRIDAALVRIGDSSSGPLAVTGTLNPGRSLRLASGSEIVFLQSVTMNPGSSFAAETGDSIRFAGADADLSVSGHGSISLTADRSISLEPGSSVSSENGDLFLSANQQASLSWGDFVGVSIDGATVQTSGAGVLSILGRGGDGGEEGGSQYGILVIDGGQVLGGSTGGLVIVGTGGPSYSDFNDGVLLEGLGSTIGSSGGNVSVTGIGGGGDSSANRGVVVRDGAILSAGGLGSVSVVGSGGIGSYYGWGSNFGVLVSTDGSITSSGGNVTVSGTGGGDASTAGNYGVFVENLFGVATASISAGGAGQLLVEGFGGATSESGPTGYPDFLPEGEPVSDDGPVFQGNHGVFLLGPGAAIQSAGGAITVRGQSQEGSFANRLGDGSSIQSNGGDLLVEGDSLDIAGSALVAAGSGTATLAPRTSGFAIDLGGTASATALGLPDAGLDRISAALVRIGGTTAGPIEVTAPISHGNHLLLATGAGATFGAGIAMAPDRNLAVEAASTISLAGGGASLSATGTGSIALQSARDIAIGTGASLSAVDGDLTLLSTAATAPAPGEFHGVALAGGSTTTNGSGNLLLEGYDLVVDGGSLSATSSGSVRLDAARAILVRGGAQLSVVDGNLDLSANIDEAPPLPGRFTGITVLGSTLSSTGEGGIALLGRGGDGSLSPDFSFTGFANPFSAGIRLAEGSVLSALGTGPYPGSIQLDGRGGGGASDSVGIVVEGSTTQLESAAGDISLLGQGGGVASGQRNRGILVAGATLGSGGAGGLLLDGSGGMGFDQIDGIQLQEGATLEVADGLMRLEGFAGGSLGIGVMATGDSGDLRVVGSGEVRLFGAGSAAPGVQLGNSNALLGGDEASSLLIESEGDLVLARPASVAGPATLRATRDEIFVEAPLASTSGDLRLEGFDLAVDAPLSATAGSLTLQFGEQDSEESEPSDGTARVNAPLVHGGSLLYLGGHGGGDFLTFQNFAPSGIELAFDELAGIEAVVGSSSPADLLRGPASGAVFEIHGTDQLAVGGVDFASFENILGGGGDDTFVFVGGNATGKPFGGFLEGAPEGGGGSSSGGFLGGTLDGGGGNDTLDYSGYPAPVAIDLSTAPFGSATGIAGGIARIGNFVAPASGPNSFFGPDAATSYLLLGPNAFTTTLFRGTGFQNLAGGAGNDRFLMGPGASLSGRLAGGSGDDLLSYAAFGRPVTVEIGPDTATGLPGGFEGIEAILGSAGNDRFRFLDQATIGFVDGGGGSDLLEIDDSSLAGDHTYTIGASSISRNPVYNFRNVEAVRLFLGSGDNTVESGFFPFAQFLHAGAGFNTLQLPGVADLGEANPVGNVYHFGFAAPRPAPEEGDTDTGSLLRREVAQRSSRLGGETKPFLTENRFSIVDPNTLAAGLALAGGAFPAALVAQASVIAIDGSSYLVMRPFSLDGSGLSPSNLAVQKLGEALGVEANLELAAALGLDEGVVLLPLDGPYAIDLSAPPADRAILALLQESLSIAAAAELSAALGLDLVVSLLAGDGIVPTALDGSAPPAAIVVVLAEQLGDPAFAELNSALSDGN